MTMRIAAFAVVSTFAAAAWAQDKPQIDPARVERAVKESWPAAPADWQARLVPDETMGQCSASENAPPQTVFEAIRAREAATVQYPPDGQFVGDWKKGERVAQSGYGLRFTDYPARNPIGGNCYACHQLTKQEVSYGTIGPGLVGYGKLRDFSPEAIKSVYEKIFNPHASFPCSLMPRFGANKVLTTEQIKDLVALLMDPESPVNQ